MPPERKWLNIFRRWPNVETTSLSRDNDANIARSEWTMDSRLSTVGPHRRMLTGKYAGLELNRVNALEWCQPLGLEHKNMLSILKLFYSKNKKEQWHNKHMHKTMIYRTKTLTNAFHTGVEPGTLFKLNITVPGIFLAFHLCPEESR